MAEDNIAAVKVMYAAFLRGDMAAVMAAAAPDIQWQLVGRQSDMPLFGDRHGHAGMQDFFQTLSQTLETEAFATHEFYGSGDKVFALGHYQWKNKATGKSAASDFVHIFTLRDGAVTGFKEFTDTARFAEAHRG